jgi:cell division protein FtsQ
MSMLSFLRSYSPGAFMRSGAHETWMDRLAYSRPKRLGLGLSVLLFGVTGAYGLSTGGQWPRIVQTYGSPGDIVANLFGFRVNTVTITGQRELTDARIFAAAGVSDTSSLLFLDCEAAREGLQKLPLVKSAQVRKLFPDTLAITIEERVPYALWQLDGAVSVVADDGTVLDHAVPERFANLPLLVGSGADKRAHEIVSLLDAAPAIGTRVKAATLVAERRWNLALDNGVVVRLPEQGADNALSALVNLERDGKVLEKDILAVDMRLPDRVAFRLSADAAAVRADALAKKAPKKGEHA